MIRTAPKVNSQRLSLDAMRPEDFDWYADLWANPDITIQIGEKPRDRRQAWELFLRNAGHWQMTGMGQWAITELKTRRMVGCTGFFFGTTTFGDDFDSIAQVTWLIDPVAQASGFGWEAIQAAHDWHDRITPGPVGAQILPGASDAIRILERLGYKRLRTVGEAETDMIHLYVRSRAPGRR